MPTVVFASNMNPRFNESLDKLGIEDRLFSYWYLKNAHPEFLRCYVNGEPLPQRKEQKHARVKLKE